MIERWVINLLSSSAGFRQKPTGQRDDHTDRGHGKATLADIPKQKNEEGFAAMNEEAPPPPFADLKRVFAKVTGGGAAAPVGLGFLRLQDLCRSRGEGKKVVTTTTTTTTAAAMVVVAEHGVLDHEEAAEPQRTAFV